MEYLATVFVFFLLIIFAVLLSFDKIILDPRDLNREIILSTSRTLGRFLITTGLSNKSVEARIGIAAFLLGAIVTFPLI